MSVPRLIRTLLLAVPGLAWSAIGPSAAFGNTIVQTLPFHLDASTPSSALAFTPFNPVSGVLTAVQVSFSDVTLTHNWWMWNLGSAGTVPFAASLSGMTFSLSDAADNGTVNFGPLSYSGSPALASIPFLTYVTEANNLQGGTPPPAGDAFHGVGSMGPDSGLLPTLVVFDPAVVAAYDPGTFALQSDGNVAWASFVAVDGKATVTYTYAAAVPDAGPGPWAAGVWVLLGLAAGFRRSKRSAN